MIEKRQQTNKGFFKKRRKLRVFLIILSVILIALAADFLIVRHIALKRFEKYEAMAQSVDTSYGKISYIDKGEGEPFLIFHGITGGYDQGFDVMGERTDSYRIIAPSRFGYPGSDLPDNATVDMQVEAFVEFLASPTQDGLGWRHCCTAICADAPRKVQGIGTVLLGISRQGKTDRERRRYDRSSAVFLQRLYDVDDKSAFQADDGHGQKRHQADNPDERPQGRHRV